MHSTLECGTRFSTLMAGPEAILNDWVIKNLYKQSKFSLSTPIVGNTDELFCKIRISINPCR